MSHRHTVTTPSGPQVEELVVTDLPHDGDWSVPMSLTEMANRLGNLPPRKFKEIAKRYGLVRLSRKLWMVRLDTMDRATRHRIETGRPPDGRVSND